MNRTHGIVSILCIAGALGAGAVFAQQRSAVEEIERYRAALGDGNPAELWEARGEALWKEKRGPNKVSLERCDLGETIAARNSRTAASCCPARAWSRPRTK